MSPCGTDSLPVRKGMCMRFLEPIWVALSTYSAVPVPQFEWTGKNMKYAICWFPAVGVLCGGALFLWDILARALNISSLCFAAVAVCVPLLITGGIHMDGYMDTVDALSSHQPRERKLEIMKDPNCGAFAVIYCGVYLLLNLGLLYELYEKNCVAVLCPIFLLSRTLSALCAVNLPNARKSGMLCAYTKNTERSTANKALGVLVFLVSVALVLICPAVGGLAVLAALCATLCYKSMALKVFGGVTGDTSGFFLQICELACLAGGWIGGFLL